MKEGGNQSKAVILQQKAELEIQNEELRIALEQKEALIRKLRDSEDIFKIFLERSPFYVFFKDENIRAIRLSRNYETMLGRPLSELLGKDMNDLFPSDLAKSMIADDISILKEGKVVTVEEELNGRIYSTIKFPIHIEGKPLYLAGFTIDVTEHKRAEEALLREKEKSEEGDRLKSAFLANLSHEIRTPMNGILGFASLLRDPDVSVEKQRKYIDIIENSGKRLLSVINDIVDISKIEAGQMEISISETDISRELEDICAFFIPEAEKKGVQLLLEMNLSPDRTIVNTDKVKIYAILSNLVKNAIKFTQHGSILIGCSVNDVRMPTELEFFVKDTGVGIAAGQQKVIFERFRQSSESLSRNYEGAGLGLSIAKAYVEMLGGTIWLKSEEGKGSAFHFNIPFGK
ncbi:MAG: PAS domain-containing protein [Bacteroidetes bacterium]|nr:PAS domain-containing protein [Bacteroidota bacterium]